MTEFRSLSGSALADLGRQLEARYAAFKAQGLKLDMTRGKPSSEQLDLASAMLDTPLLGYTARDGTDGRNYLCPSPGYDPRDRNIRVAPSLPPLDQIRVAMEVVAVCVALASVGKLSA